MKFLIWSNEHGAWWRPNSCGYTKDQSDAGQYDLQEATDICLSANRGDRFPEETIQPVREAT